MSSPLSEEIVQLVKTAERVAWIGNFPPDLEYTSMPEISSGETCYRAAPARHQVFDMVFLCEQDLGLLKHWRLVVDEALRLLKPGGSIVLRFKESPFISIFGLKSFLFSWAQGQLAIVFENKTSDGYFTSCFRLTHAAPRETDVKRWSFGLLSDGRRPENVRKFIESVERVRGLEDYEILICGPSADVGDRPRVRFLDSPIQFAKEGWITRKKNLIVGEASFANVVVAHDRYVIPEDFVEQMEKFGGDFDVVTARQVTPSGERFPDWVALGAEWTWTPGAVMNYADSSPYGYVNGGIMIAKTAVLRAVPWNELLFWNQGEDVELSRRIDARGFVHRMNRNLVVTTLDARPGYREFFLEIPMQSDSYILPGGATYLPFKFFDGATISSFDGRRLPLPLRALVGLVGVLGLKRRAGGAFTLLKPKLVAARTKLYKLSPSFARRIETQLRVLREALKR